VNDFGEAKVMVWWFRWNASIKPGCWVVSLFVPGFNVRNMAAVMDDFGKLVEVPR
jgi:hypothetical protein